MLTATNVKHILVIDDNPGDVGLIKEALAQTDGVVVHAVINIVQALSFLYKKSPFSTRPTPDLVFLDLRLPIFPGHNLLSTIKGDPSMGHVKIVVFTSSNLKRDHAQCARLGADDYLVKPREWAQWKSLIAKVLAEQCGVMIGDSRGSP